MEYLWDEQLPIHWNYAATDEGRVFFINDEFKTTSWLHPKSKQPIQTGFFQDPKLPDGWEIDLTQDRVPYLIDHNTCSTSWTLPPEKPSSSSSKQDLKRSASPFKRSNSRRKSLKQKAPDVKRDKTSEVTKRGWLYRQEGGPGPLKTWKKRWCVLSQLCLFIYKGPEEGELLSSVLLPSYQILPCSKDSANKKYIFKAEHENMKTIHFAGDSVEEAEEWMEVMDLASLAIDSAQENPKMSVIDQLRDQQYLQDVLPSTDPPKQATSTVNEFDFTQKYNNNNNKFSDDIPQSQHQVLKMKSSMESESKRIDEKERLSRRSYDSSKNEIHRINSSPNKSQEKSLLQKNYIKSPTHKSSGHDNSKALYFQSRISGKELGEKVTTDVYVPETGEVLDDTNFERVKEWTEEQNMYKKEILATTPLDDVKSNMNLMITEPKLDFKQFEALRASNNDLVVSNLSNQNVDSSSRLYLEQDMELFEKQNSYESNSFAYNKIIPDNRNIYTRAQQTRTPVSNEEILDRNYRKTSSSLSFEKDLEIRKIEDVSSNKSQRSLRSSEDMKSLEKEIIQDRFGMPVSSTLSINSLKHHNYYPNNPSPNVDHAAPTRIKNDDQRNDLRIVASSDGRPNILAARESVFKNNLRELISKSTNCFQNAAIFLESVNSSGRNSPALNDQVVKILIQLRRNQGDLHEFLYNLISESFSKSLNPQDKTVSQRTLESEIDRNSEMISQLEACLYSRTKNVQNIEKQNMSSHDLNLISGSSSVLDQTDDQMWRPKKEIISSTNIEDKPEMLRTRHNVQQVEDKKSARNEVLSSSADSSTFFSPETRPSTFPTELTFFETDLDSFQTKDIAMFSYGVKPSDLITPSLLNGYKESLNIEEKSRQKGDPETNFFYVNSKNQNQSISSSHSSNQLKDYYLKTVTDHDSSKNQRKDNFSSEIQKLHKRTDEHLSAYRQLNQPNENSHHLPGTNKYSFPTANQSHDLPSSNNSFSFLSNNKSYNQSINNKFNTPAEKPSHNVPASNNTYYQRPNDNSYNQPASNKSYNQNPSNRLYNQPASNNFYNQPASNNSYNQHPSSNLYNQPASIKLHSIPTKNNSYNQAADISVYKKQYNIPDNDKRYELPTSNTSNSTKLYDPPYRQQELPQKSINIQRPPQQYKQSLVPLKSSDGSKAYNFQNDSNRTSPRRQRTKSFSEEEHGVTGESVIRSSKSSQNLNEKTEEEETGFRSRSNTRRLSGIFTPRPFYKKSQNSKEGESAKDSEYWKDEESYNAFFDKKPQSDHSDEPKLSAEEVMRRKEKSEKLKRIVAAQSLTEFNKEELTSHLGDLKKRLEDEKSRRQQVLELRTSLAQQITSKQKYYDS